MELIRAEGDTFDIERIIGIISRGEKARIIFPKGEQYIALSEQEYNALVELKLKTDAKAIKMGFKEENDVSN